MKILRNEDGQMVVMTALSIALLMGFVAMAVDVGLLFRARRNMQIAADAAATAGALDLYFSQSSADATLAGQRAAAANGVTNGSGGSVVTINNPPLSGYHTGSAFVEAIVSQPKPVFFMSVFGYSSPTVAARAVAGLVSGQNCLTFNNPTGPDLVLQGAATITNPSGGETCGAVILSTSSDSVEVKGLGNTIDTTYVATLGGLQASGNSQTTPTATTTVASVPPVSPILVSDAANAPVPGVSPYASCIAPSGGTTKIQNTTYTYITNGSTLSPGCYGTVGGNMMLGNGTGMLTLADGMYVFTGNVAIGNNLTGGSSAGDGVTLDIYNGSLTVTSTASVSLYAPTSGTWNATTCSTCGDNGVLLLAPPTNTSTWNIQWGSSGGSAGLAFNGIIDAPGVNLTMQDQGGAVLVTGINVGSMSMQTSTLLIDNYSTAHPTTSPMLSVALVE